MTQKNNPPHPKICTSCNIQTCCFFQPGKHRQGSVFYLHDSWEDPRTKLTVGLLLLSDDEHSERLFMLPDVLASRVSAQYCFSNLLPCSDLLLANSEYIGLNLAFNWHIQEISSCHSNSASNSTLDSASDTTENLFVVLVLFSQGKQTEQEINCNICNKRLFKRPELLYAAQIRVAEMATNAERLIPASTTHNGQITKAWIRGNVFPL